MDYDRAVSIGIELTVLTELKVKKWKSTIRDLTKAGKG